MSSKMFNDYIKNNLYIDIITFEHLKKLKISETSNIVLNIIQRFWGLKKKQKHPAYFKQKCILKIV